MTRPSGQLPAAPRRYQKPSRRRTTRGLVSKVDNQTQLLNTRKPGSLYSPTSTIPNWLESNQQTSACIYGAPNSTCAIRQISRQSDKIKHCLDIYQFKILSILRLYATEQLRKKKRAVCKRMLRLDHFYFHYFCKRMHRIHERHRYMSRTVDLSKQHVLEFLRILPTLPTKRLIKKHNAGCLHSRGVLKI